MRRIVCFWGTCLLFTMSVYTQEAGNYGYLNITNSARISALGGVNISVVEPDLELAEQNPALLCPEMGDQFSLSYLNYASDIQIGAAAYSSPFLTEGAWAVSMKYVDYGTFDGYDENGFSTGTFSAKDMALSAALGYPINEHWRFGVAARFLYSTYESYDALALSVDLGINYYDEVAGRSFSITLNHLGGQLKSFEDSHTSLPTQLVLGVTKELEHLPFCLSFTAYDLLNWDTDYIESGGKKTSFNNAEQILNHIIWGVEWVPMERFFLSVSYNYRRQRQFSNMGGFLRGVSMGGGFRSQRFSLQCAYTRHNAADGSLTISCGYRL